MKNKVLAVVIATLLSQSYCFVSPLNLVGNAAASLSKASQSATDFGRQATAAGQKNVNEKIQAFVDSRNEILEVPRLVSSLVPGLRQVVSNVVVPLQTGLTAAGNTAQGIVNTEAKIADAVLSSANGAVQGTVGRVASLLNQGESVAAAEVAATPAPAQPRHGLSSLWG